MNAFATTVLARLGPIEPDEMPTVLGAIARLEQDKWLPSEASSYLRWMEHVDPTIDEDTAVRNMKAVRMRVEARLENDC